MEGVEDAEGLVDGEGEVVTEAEGGMKLADRLGVRVAVPVREPVLVPVARVPVDVGVCDHDDVRDGVRVWLTLGLAEGEQSPRTAVRRAPGKPPEGRAAHDPFTPRAPESRATVAAPSGPAGGGPYEAPPLR